LILTKFLEDVLPVIARQCVLCSRSCRIYSLSKSKYTNRSRAIGCMGMCTIEQSIDENQMTSVKKLIDVSLSFSGSDQARKGRLVDALAVRGDEGRSTLR
jgi:hypothetical protein